jgi:agmatine deiminase
MTKTPAELGYSFPAEWCRHKATWLSYPHNEVSFPGKIHTIYPFYFEFIKQVSKGEWVCINVVDEKMKALVESQLQEYNINQANVKILFHPNNDAWCRDHGPAFLVNPNAEQKKVIVSWDYNAWGGQYPSELDNQIPDLIGKYYDIPVYHPGIVMEGGSVDFNGKGTVLTTTSCLLHENRNPGLKQTDIEKYLCDFYGVEQVLWLGDGINGDDTNGHVDDMTRFVNEDTVVTAIETNKKDENYKPLNENLAMLKKMRLLNGKQLNIVELPMPDAVVYNDQRLPASYANFYISNAAIVVPTYRCKNDEKAIHILEEQFRDRPVIGIDSTEIIWGLGSWHCLSQQEPED